MSMEKDQPLVKPNENYGSLLLHPELVRPDIIQTNRIPPELVPSDLTPEDIPGIQVSKRSIPGASPLCLLDLRVTEAILWVWAPATDVSPTAVSKEATKSSDPVAFLRFLKSVHPEDQTRLSQEIHTAAGRQGQFVLQYRTTDGNPMALCGQQVGNPSVDERQLMGICLDLAERRQMEERLVQSHRLESLGRLAGGVAHDFNNLLTVMAGHAHMLRDTAQKTEEASNSVTQILVASEKAGALTRQLLRLSHRTILKPAVLHLKDTVSDARPMLHWLLGGKIQIQEILDPQTCPVRMDLGQFQQVLLDLAANARDAMPDGGILTVRTRNHRQIERGTSPWFVIEPGEYVVLEVADNGRGIRPEIMDHLFEPFLSSKTGNGTGLGLSTIYRIVQESGGFIEVETSPGKGTRFQIYFPRVQSSITSTVIF